MKTCFLCGIETTDDLVRSTLPKELIGKDENGNIVEDFHPVCRKCYYFKRAVDINFINLCKDTKLFEWYRPRSKKQGDFFPAELVYNVDLDELRELYYAVLNVCEAADKVSCDEEHRKKTEDDLNYYWRKKDA